MSQIKSVNLLIDIVSVTVSSSVCSGLIKHNNSKYMRQLQNSHVAATDTASKDAFYFPCLWAWKHPPVRWDEEQCPDPPMTLQVSARITPMSPIITTLDNVDGAVMWQRHFESSPGSSDECQTAASSYRPSDQANKTWTIHYPAMKQIGPILTQNHNSRSLHGTQANRLRLWVRL